MEGFAPHPLRNSSFGSNFASKILAFKTSIPLPSTGLGMDLFLELHNCVRILSTVAKKGTMH